ncbi:hypothetical protein U3516DRAFT_643372 [Neocallimastix sp. 'constans']
MPKINRISSFQNQSFPYFQRPQFPTSFFKSISGFAQKHDYKHRFQEKNSLPNIKRVDIFDDNIRELKERIKKYGNPEKYIISKISNRKKNDVTESVIDALILVIERIWPDEYITELKDEEIDFLRKNNIKLPSYLYKNYIDEQQNKDQRNDYDSCSSSSSSSDSNTIYASPTSVLNNDSNNPNEDGMMEYNNAMVSKYSSYDGSINQKKSIFSTLSSFIPQLPQFSGYEYSPYFRGYGNSLNYPKRMVNSLKNKYSDLENKMYSKMMSSLSKAYKLKEVASTSNPMNFLLNSSGVDSNNRSNNSNKEETKNDGYEYDETDTENYYCNTLARKSLSAASSIKSLSSSIIDNISYLKPNSKASSSSTRIPENNIYTSNYNMNIPNISTTEKMKTNEFTSTETQSQYENEYTNDSSQSKYNQKFQDNNTEFFDKIKDDMTFNNSSRRLPFSGRHAILACLILCSKFYYDNDVPMIKNKFWQTFCGLSINSLNYIQYKVLDLLDYNLVIEADRFSRFAGVMLTYTHLKNQIFFSEPYLTYNRRSIHLDILTTIALTESEQLQDSLVKSVNKFKKHWQNYLKEGNSLSHQDKNTHDKEEKKHQTNNENNYSSYHSRNGSERDFDKNLNNNKSDELKYRSQYYSNNSDTSQIKSNDNNDNSSYNYSTRIKNDSSNYMNSNTNQDLYNQPNSQCKEIDPSYLNTNESIIKHEKDIDYLRSQRKGKFLSFTSNNTQQEIQQDRNINNNTYNTMSNKYENTKNINDSPVIRTQQIYAFNNDRNSDESTYLSNNSSSIFISKPHEIMNSNSNISNGSNVTTPLSRKKYSSNLLFKRVDNSYHMDLWKSLVHNYYYEPNSENSQNYDSNVNSQEKNNIKNDNIFSNNDKKLFERGNYKLIKTDQNNVHNNFHMLESNFMAIDNEYFKVESSRIRNNNNNNKDNNNSNNENNNEPIEHDRHSADISIQNICIHEDENTSFNNNSQSSTTEKNNNLFNDSINIVNIRDASSQTPFNFYHIPESHHSSSINNNRIINSNNNSDNSNLSNNSSYNSNYSRKSSYLINSTENHEQKRNYLKNQSQSQSQSQYQYQYQHQHSNNKNDNYSNYCVRPERSDSLINRNNKRNRSSFTLQNKIKTKVIKSEFDDDVKYKKSNRSNIYSKNNNINSNHIIEKVNAPLKTTIKSEDDHFTSQHNHVNILDTQSKMESNQKNHFNTHSNTYTRTNHIMTNDETKEIRTNEKLVLLNHVKKENDSPSMLLSSIFLSPTGSNNSMNNNDDNFSKEIELPNIINSPTQRDVSSNYLSYNSNSNNNNSNNINKNIMSFGKNNRNNNKMSISTIIDKP